MKMPEGTQWALKEALEAIENHLHPQSHPNEFALHFHGREHATEDLDFAINTPLLNQWKTSVVNNSRFTYLQARWGLALLLHRGRN
jgi:hypothetical protein